MTHRTGAWHWNEAERLLDQAEKMGEEFDMSWPELAAKRDELLHRADVHAKLSMAARDYGFHVEEFRPEPANPDTIAANEKEPTR